MGSRLRMYEPNKVYEVVTGTVDREFLFVPNSHPNDPLLHRDCPLDAFDPKNDTTPKPSIFNIVGFAFARALELTPVNLHCVEQNIGHLHIEVSGDEISVGQIPAFFRDAHSSIARQINKAYDREGHVFSSRYRATCCEDDEAAEDKLYYAITNIVKDGIVRRQDGKCFLSSYPSLAKGEQLKFWKIDWERYHKKGGARVKKHRPKDYIVWKELDFSWIAPLLKLTEPQRRTRVRKQIQKRVESINKTVSSPMGRRQLRFLNPRSRPKQSRNRSPQPLCHATTREARQAYRKRFLEFKKEYRAASADYRAGNYYREFPMGSCRPPLIKIMVFDDF